MNLDQLPDDQFQRFYDGLNAIDSSADGISMVQYIIYNGKFGQKVHELEQTLYGRDGMQPSIDALAAKELQWYEALS